MSSAQPEATLELDPAQVAEGALHGSPQGAHTPATQLVDVREPYEREAGHIQDSMHIELTELPAAAAAARLGRELPVVFYCRTGSRSLMAAQAFRASGYEAYSLRGGLLRWVAEGLPLSPGDGYVAEH